MSRKRLGYKTRHVMLNLKDEWYEKMKGEGINMSALVNRFLDEYFDLEVCPHCLIGEVLNRNCAKCEAPAIICDNSSCSRAGSWSIAVAPRTCTSERRCTTAPFRSFTDEK